MTKKHLLVRYKQTVIVIIATTALVIFLTSWQIILGNNTGVEIIPEEEFAFVIVDEQVRGVTQNPNETINLGLSEGEHQILTSKENHWPWSKNLVIGEEENGITLMPFYIPQNPVRQKIDSSHQQYEMIQNFFANYKMPTKESRSSSRDGKVSVWIEDDHKLFAQWVGNSDPARSFCQADSCRGKKEIFSSDRKITAVDFYKNRNDVFIVSTEDIVFVIEANRDEPQNFQPIYEGQGLKFVIPENPNDLDLLFVKEGVTTYAIWI